LNRYFEIQKLKKQNPNLPPIWPIRPINHALSTTPRRDPSQPVAPPNWPKPDALPRPAPRGVNGTDIIRPSDRPKRLIIRLNRFFRISAEFSDFGFEFGYYSSDIGYGYGTIDIRRISDIRISSRITIRISYFGYPDIYPDILPDFRFQIFG
jgi:hypothetical protein